MRRLNIRAKHKGEGKKFDSMNFKEKQNVVITKEDIIDSQTTPWIGSLRPSQPEKHRELILKLREKAKLDGKNLSRDNEEDKDD